MSNPEQKMVAPVETKQPGELDDGVMRFVVSTDSEDRDGDVIEPEGIRLGSYRDNPVFLPFHEQKRLPAGRAVAFDKSEDGLVVDIEMVSRDDLSGPGGELSEQAKLALNIGEWYRAGYLNAVSIGFRPVEGGVQQRPESDGFRFTAVELMEISAVPVPSNQEALVEMRGAKGYEKSADRWAEKWLDRGFDGFPEPPKRFRDNLEIGLGWVEEGFGGDGLQQSTVEWAERMAGGEKPTRDKATKMGSFLARHLAQDNPKRDDDGGPTPYAVALKLWGGEGAGPAYTRSLYRVMDREIPEGLADKSADVATKESRTLSKANEERIKGAMAQLDEVLKDHDPESAMGIAGGDMDDDKGASTPCRITYESGPLTKTIEAATPEQLQKIADQDIDPREKGATAFQDYPLAARDRQWDSDAAVGRWRDYTGSQEAPSVEYRDGFLWFDEQSAENFGAYKLPYVDIIDDRPVAVPRAIFTIASVLQGGMGGVNVPQSDLPDLREHVTRYYTKMRNQFDDESIVAPWNTEDEMKCPHCHETIEVSAKAGTETDEEPDKGAEESTGDPEGEPDKGRDEDVVKLNFDPAKVQ